MRASIEPRIAALHDLYVELVALQIRVVHCGDFQFSTGAGFDGFGNVNHLVVVEIQASDGVVAFGLGRFFFDAAGFALGIKRYHAIALRVLHMVGENGGTGWAVVCVGQELGKIVAMKDVVAQHQCAGGAAKKLFANDESLGQAVGAGLHGVLQMHAPLAAVAQELGKAWGVLRGADD